MHLRTADAFGDLSLGEVIENRRVRTVRCRSGRAAIKGRTVSTLSTLSRFGSTSPALSVKPL